MPKIILENYLNEHLDGLKHLHPAKQTYFRFNNKNRTFYHVICSSFRTLCDK